MGHVPSTQLPSTFPSMSIETPGGCPDPPRSCSHRNSALDGKNSEVDDPRRSGEGQRGEGGPPVPPTRLWQHPLARPCGAPSRTRARHARRRVPARLAGRALARATGGCGVAALVSRRRGDRPGATRAARLAQRPRHSAARPPERPACRRPRGGIRATPPTRQRSRRAPRPLAQHPG